VVWKKRAVGYKTSGTGGGRIGKSVGKGDNEGNMGVSWGRNERLREVDQGSSRCQGKREGVTHINGKEEKIVGGRQ